MTLQRFDEKINFPEDRESGEELLHVVADKLAEPLRSYFYFGTSDFLRRLEYHQFLTLANDKTIPEIIDLVVDQSPKTEWTRNLKKFVGRPDLVEEYWNKLVEAVPPELPPVVPDGKFENLQFGKEYFELFKSIGLPIREGDCLSIEAIQNLEDEDSNKLYLPDSLSEFYIVAGNMPPLTQTHNRFLSIEKLVLDGYRLIFLNENQLVCRRAVECDQPSVDGPVFQGLLQDSKTMKLAWYDENDSCFTFVKTMLIWNATFGGGLSNGYVGRVDKSQADRELLNWRFVGETNGMSAFVHEGKCCCLLEWPGIPLRTQKGWHIFVGTNHELDATELSGRFGGDWFDFSSQKGQFNVERVQEMKFENFEDRIIFPEDRRECGIAISDLAQRFSKSISPSFFFALDNFARSEGFDEFQRITRNLNVQELLELVVKDDPDSSFCKKLLPFVGHPELLKELWDRRP